MKAKKTSETAARDLVVLEHLGSVKAIALRIHANALIHVELDDLVHAGILGLFDAVEKYNPEKLVLFSTYATYRIKGAILDSLRQLDYASRDVRCCQRQLEGVTRELSATLQRMPNESEVAERLGMSVDQWRQSRMNLRPISLVSASACSNDYEAWRPPDLPSKPETRPDHMCGHWQMRSILESVMKTLPLRYQKVVLLYYTNDMTMKEIGCVLDINESRVSQMRKVALAKMHTALQSRGVLSIHAF